MQGKPGLVPTQLGVFAKYWTPGRVKTRLAASLGPEQAAEIAHAFVETLLARLHDNAHRCVLGFSPADHESEFRSEVDPRWQLAPQCEGDLGCRMRHYFQTAFDAGAERVVLLGADSPNVPLTAIADAFERLRKQKLVLGPTGDGGYYLVGARRIDSSGEPPPIFDAMPWSEQNLWTATTARLNEIGWRDSEDWSAVAPWYDVDTVDDFARLQADLAGTDNDLPLARLAERLSRIQVQ